MFWLLGNGSVKLYPRLLGFGIGVVTTAITAHQYMKFQTQALEESVYKNMEKGSKPLLPKKRLIPREDIAEEVKRFFFPEYKAGKRETDDKYANGFGIIVGPTGSGKTTLVVNLCNKFPQGVLYYHSMEPEVFSENLAETVAMKIHPSSIFDLVLGYFSSDYFMYYRLSEKPKVAVRTIFKVLEKAARRYKHNHGKIPTLFIDGADILAKRKEDLFVQLVYEAKVLANAEILTIVFVSSEGSILPVVQRLSEVSRSSKVLEVGDIEDKDAVNFLMRNGLSKKLSENIVAYSGGRFVYLYKCMNLYRAYSSMYPNMTDDLMYKKLMEDVFIWKLNGQKLTVTQTNPISEALFNELSSKGEIYPAEVMKSDNTIAEVILKLVEANILRYTSKGSLQWHGRPQQREFAIET